jgi:hypothetical protein
MQLPKIVNVPVELLTAPAPNVLPLASPEIVNVPVELLFTPKAVLTVADPVTVPTRVAVLGVADKKLKQVVVPAKQFADKEILLLIIKEPPANPPVRGDVVVNKVLTPVLILI